MTVPIFRSVDVSHSFRVGGGRRDVAVLSNVNVALQPAEVVALLGPSGSGKSTLLTIVAGLLEPESGVVEVNGSPVPNRLGLLSYMPQKDLLLPWRDARDNAALGLEVSGVSRTEAQKRATSMLATFGLSGFATARPAQLSGGMRQRVALIRTFLPGRDVLLDEPFGALDAMTRAELQVWLMQLQTATGRAVFLITHDIDEALLLADRVYLLSRRPGRIRAELSVDLPRPRDIRVTATTPFMALKSQLLGLLGEEGTSSLIGPVHA